MSNWKCEECGYEGKPIPCCVPPTIFEPDGMVNKCPNCGWSDM